jgi:hypothetical protein
VACYVRVLVSAEVLDQSSMALKGNGTTPAATTMTLPLQILPSQNPIPFCPTSFQKIQANLSNLRFGRDRGRKNISSYL